MLWNGTASLLETPFQPFLRFYMFSCVKLENGIMYVEFQPFLRFYPNHGMGGGRPHAVESWFQPFLRFYC